MTTVAKPQAPTKTPIKTKVQYVCTECGETSPKWQGQCNGSSAWNTLEVATWRPAAPRSARNPSLAVIPTNLASINSQDASRLSTGMPEVDGVLGGGVIAGSLILLGGDPGIGKSTLALQLARNCG